MTTALLDLGLYGISDIKEIVRNPSYDQLYEEELNPDLVGYERGVVTKLGAINVKTGVFTGRSPKDKYLVLDDTTRDTVWWSDGGKNDNKPITPAVWNDLKELVVKELSGKRLFVIDGFCGANPDSRLAVRIITEVAWQAHFAKNMFIRPSEEELVGFEPDFVVLNGSETVNPNWKEHGLNSEKRVVLSDELPVTAAWYCIYALFCQCGQRW